MTRVWNDSNSESETVQFVVDPHKNHLSEAVLMKGHNIMQHGKNNEETPANPTLPTVI